MEMEGTTPTPPAMDQPMEQISDALVEQSKEEPPAASALTASGSSSLHSHAQQLSNILSPSSSPIDGLTTKDVEEDKEHEISFQDPSVTVTVQPSLSAGSLFADEPPSGGAGEQLEESAPQEQPAPYSDRRAVYLDRRAGYARESTWKHLGQLKLDIEDEARRRLFPEGFTKQLIPLCLSVVALTFTGAGSWECSYFKGASIGFTGGKYGLWTLEDSRGSCQLWDVLFFSYDLGAPLEAARVFSMAAMLIGLGLTVTMAQASQFHLSSIVLGLAFFLMFIVSVSTSSMYNVWAVFWFLTYLLMILIVRFTFIHPIHRRISERGAKIISGCFLLCAVCSLLTLVVLKSEFCTCSGLTNERLAGRDPGDPCNGTCELGPAGYCMIMASVFYCASAVACLKFGIQPQVLQQNARRPREIYANYPQQSMVSRVQTLVYGTPKETTEAAKNKTTNKLTSTTSTGSSASSLSPTVQEDADYVVSNDASATGAAFTPTLNAIGEETEAPPEQHQHQQQNTKRSEQTHEEQEGKQEEEDLDQIWEKLDKRSCCQKCCCDFRVVPRTRNEKIRFWVFRTALTLGFVVYVVMIFLLVGSRTESTKAAESPDTTPYFTTPQVCAFHPQNPNAPFQTFPNQEAAHARNWTIAHCGACGHCSNPHDIITYVETRKTIAQSSKKCGPKTFLASYEDLADCLEDRIGFRRECTYCWADNMVNTGKDCLSTCMRTLFSGFMTDNNIPGSGEQGWMNQCLFCDEKRSGPNFVTCSGVARRRLGIVSEIERNPLQQCKRVDVDWVIVKWEDIGFQKDDPGFSAGTRTNGLPFAAVWWSVSSIVVWILL